MPLLVFMDFPILLPRQWSSGSWLLQIQLEDQTSARSFEWLHEEHQQWQSLSLHAPWPLSVRRGLVVGRRWFDLEGGFCPFSAIKALFFSGIKDMVNWWICFVSWHTVLSMTCSSDDFRSVNLCHGPTLPWQGCHGHSSVFSSKVWYRHAKLSIQAESKAWFHIWLFRCG